MNPGGTLTRFDHTQAMTTAVARRFRQSVFDAVKRYGRCNIGLSGGRGPQGLFRFLGAGAREDLPWSKMGLYWVDERWVPHGHDDSNYGVARRLWLDPLGLASIAHPVDTSMATAQASAADYEAMLYNRFGHGPLFDLCLLGMGDDGHVASLFPGSPALEETRRYCVAAPGPGGGLGRVTLTLPALNACRSHFFLVTGKAKLPMLEQVVAGSAPRLPASHVDAGGSEWFWSPAEGEQP